MLHEYAQNSVRERDAPTLSLSTRSSNVVRCYTYMLSKEIRQGHAPLGHVHMPYVVQRALTGVSCAPNLHKLSLARKRGHARDVKV